jgi:hypothetical protein
MNAPMKIKSIFLFLCLVVNLGHAEVAEQDTSVWAKYCYTVDSIPPSSSACSSNEKFMAYPAMKLRLMDELKPQEEIYIDTLCSIGDFQWKFAFAQNNGWNLQEDREILGGFGSALLGGSHSDKHSIFDFLSLRFPDHLVVANGKNDLAETMRYLATLKDGPISIKWTLKSNCRYDKDTSGTYNVRITGECPDSLVLQKTNGELKQENEGRP